MSDNRKYYYIKLKENYFDQDNIKVLESVNNGHIYSLIIVKLYLKATKYGGQLRMTESIPYDPTKIDILANVLNHDIAHVKEAIRVASELGIITILDDGQMWMAEIQNFIGQSSTEADRIRDYRNRLSVQMYDKSTPELDIDKDIDIDIEINTVSKKPTKHKHGEYKNVLLSDTQYSKLLEDWGKEKLDFMILKLDEGIQLKAYKYKDHNLAIRKWEKETKFIPKKEQEEEFICEVF